MSTGFEVGMFVRKRAGRVVFEITGIDPYGYITAKNLNTERTQTLHKSEIVQVSNPVVNYKVIETGEIGRVAAKSEQGQLALKLESGVLKVFTESELVEIKPYIIKVRGLIDGGHTYFEAKEGTVKEDDILINKEGLWYVVQLNCQIKHQVRLFKGQRLVAEAIE